MTLNTPVAFFIFRRPDTTQRVFDVISAVKPRKLFLIADGPRNADEAALVAQTRAIFAHIDWECDVRTNFAEVNLGLKVRVSSGLDWVFDQVENAIILEDDCLPHPSFFPFCEWLLQHYRDDERVMHISGDYFHAPLRLPTDVYFSRYPYIWGWATWRRAWARYDVKMKQWEDPSVRSAVLSRFQSRSVRRFWQHTFDKVASGTLNTWDYQWTFACLAHHGLAINPAVNLITNIGFGADSTNTIESANILANLSVEPVRVPPRLPPSMVCTESLDAQIEALFFSRPSGFFFRQAVRKAMRVLAQTKLQR
ncbi:MAG: glycosyltransferase family 2 protein [Anaerolineae bacterium]|nr:glycosyltransferase family 2 protein [Anaerolineae bacterium]